MQSLYTIVLSWLLEPQLTDLDRLNRSLLVMALSFGLWHLLYSIFSYERRQLTRSDEVLTHRLENKGLKAILASVALLLLLFLPLRWLLVMAMIAAVAGLAFWIYQIVQSQSRFRNRGNQAIDLETLKRHVIMIDQHGIALDPLPQYHLGHVLGLVPDFKQLSKADYQAYMQAIFAQLETRQDVKEVVIFIHGGLNEFKAALVRAHQRLAAMQADGIYPIFILWRSGLFACYWAHLTQFVQGKSPRTDILGRSYLFFANLLLDAGRSITRFPRTLYYQFHSEYSAVRPAIEHDADNIPLLYHVLRTRSANAKNAFHIKRDVVDGETYGEFRAAVLRELLSPLKLAFRYAVWPLIDALGTSAWDMMLRRTETLFRSPDEFDISHRSPKAYAPEPENPKHSLVVNILDGEPSGALALFVRAYMDKAKTIPTSLIGHSMGAIVLNNWLSYYPKFQAEQIIYMAAACTIQQAVRSLSAYLALHPQSSFYNLSLHQRAEKTEQHVFGLSPMGSLLEWIDNYFSKPLTFDQRTFGKWDNLMQATQLFPHKIRGQITLKAFPVSGDGATTFIPTKHGDFTFCKFWNADFYELSKAENTTPEDLNLAQNINSS
jgi:hypothetical protein